MTVGKRIAKCRKDKNLSQEYVAEQLGVSRQAVSKWENDLSAPDTYNLIALAKLFNVSVEYIACGNGETEESDTPKDDLVDNTSNAPSKKPKSCFALGFGFSVTGIGATWFCFEIVTAILGLSDINLWSLLCGGIIALIGLNIMDFI